MPPAQCPDCGRFLKKDLIASLAEGPQPCPKCERPLTAADFGVAASATTAPSPAPLAERAAPDPLATWDQSPAAGTDLVGAGPPPDAAIMAGASAAGALLGALIAKRRIRGAIIGGALGAAAAGVAQQIWELPE